LTSATTAVEVVMLWLRSVYLKLLVRGPKGSH
jgi:hypothetical protein